MGKYRFIRDTTLREGRREHKAGEVLELSGAALRHWVLRGAVEAAQGSAKAKPPEAPLEPPAPPVTPPAPPAEPETPAEPVEPVHAPKDDDHPRNRPEPVVRPAAKSARSAPAKKSTSKRGK